MASQTVPTGCPNGTRPAWPFGYDDGNDKSSFNKHQIVFTFTCNICVISLPATHSQYYEPIRIGQVFRLAPYWPC